MSISFYNKKKLNIIYLVILCLFPLYKYSSFNFGIGNYDSFPSIIKKESKTNIIWAINENKINNFKKAFINFEGYFKKAYIILKLKHKNIEIIDQAIKKEDKNKICMINFSNSKFEIH